MDGFLLQLGEVLRTFPVRKRFSIQTNLFKLVDEEITKIEQNKNTT